MLAQGADMKMANVNGRTPLHNAAFYGNANIVELLLNHPDSRTLLNEKDLFGSTPLDIAIYNHHDKVIKLLAPDSDLNQIKQSELYKNGKTQIPPGMRVSICGGLHATSFHITDDHKFNYYDPNFR